MTKQFLYSDLFKPTYLKTLCETYTLTPSKKYGQNYLISSAPVEKMIAVAGVNKKDTIIEIGPGFGVLTFALAEKAKRVIACEIEKKLETYWEEYKPENVEIIWGNAINKIQDTSNKIQEYKVVANLPYQITSHVLRTLLELENKPQSITVMVQKEVADRIIAKPGDMSLLAVAIQYYGTPKIVTKVSKGNFWPSPKVDSAVIHVDTSAREHMSTLEQNEFDEMFFCVARAGFANKRKQLWRNLYTGLHLEKEFVVSIITEVCGNEKVRAQELSVEQWITLSEKLSIVL